MSTSDSALNRARPCTRVGPMGHESHAGPRSRTTHAPALTPDLTLSTECRFIIGHKLRRKNLCRTRYAASSRFRVLLSVRLLVQPLEHSLLDATRNLVPTFSSRLLQLNMFIVISNPGKIIAGRYLVLWIREKRKDYCNGCNSTPYTVFFVFLISFWT